MKTLRIIALTVLGLIGIFLVAGYFIGKAYDSQPINVLRNNFAEKVEFFSEAIAKANDTTTAFAYIDSLEQLINTVPIDSLYEHQQADFKTIDSLLENKHEWKNNIIVEQRVRGLFLLDGSNPEFVRLVKDNLNDPDSFEHVETTYYTNADMTWVALNMKFRAKNAFGGTVTNTATCQLHDNGSIKNLVIR